MPLCVHVFGVWYGPNKYNAEPNVNYRLLENVGNGIFCCAPFFNMKSNFEVKLRDFMCSYVLVGVTNVVYDQLSKMESYIIGSWDGNM